jgi:hypothetical protein
MLLLGVIAWISMSTPYATRQDDAERRLWDTEFLKKRRPTTTATPSRPAPVYKPAAPTPAPPAPSSANAAPPAAVPADTRTGEVLGVTIWRLRQSTASDLQDSRLLIQEDAATAAVEWTPERVEADTAFTEGERIRLGIESPRDGYLYVVDREQYADGTTSDPYLIFPTLRMRSGDNGVSAGKLIELPDRSAFRLRGMRVDYRGELLTVIVTPRPLTDVSAGPSAQRLDRALVERWEKQWGGRVQRFELEGGAGRPYSSVERRAGVEGRLLTQDDELPQSIYHVTGSSGDPLVVSIPLRIAK